LRININLSEHLLQVALLLLDMSHLRNLLFLFFVFFIGLACLHLFALFYHPIPEVRCGSIGFYQANFRFAFLGGGVVATLHCVPKIKDEQ
jgi:hypothetical protein